MFAEREDLNRLPVRLGNEEEGCEDGSGKRVGDRAQHRQGDQPLGSHTSAHDGV